MSRRHIIKNYAHTLMLYHDIGMLDPFENIFVIILEHRALRQCSVSLQCGNGSLVSHQSVRPCSNMS